MKRILFILAIAIFTSCSTEKENCKCTAKYMLDNGNTFFVENNPIDCDNKQPTQLAPSGWFIGCVD